MKITAERYDVFARKARLEPLQHLGGVSATSPELAYVYAVTTFDEQKRSNSERSPFGAPKLSS